MYTTVPLMIVILSKPTFIFWMEMEKKLLLHISITRDFQYVEVTSSQAVHLDKEGLVAYFMHSDITPIV